MSSHLSFWFKRNGTKRGPLRTSSLQCLVTESIDSGIPFSVDPSLTLVNEGSSEVSLSIETDYDKKDLKGLHLYWQTPNRDFVNDLKISLDDAKVLRDYLNNIL